jgi:hypothetical protein
LAKELSAKGKAAAEAMWAAHERASSQIYTQRNARLQQQVAAAGKGSAAAPVIDLHGECCPGPVSHTLLSFCREGAWGFAGSSRKPACGSEPLVLVSCIGLDQALTGMGLGLSCRVYGFNPHAAAAFPPPVLQGCMCRK